MWGPTLVTDLHLGGYVMFIGSDIAMTAVAIGLARSRRACRLRGGRTRARASTAAGVGRGGRVS